jgi:S1-C subfamily serine protease/thiol-disulfide isomerase/thioredoxin
MINESMNDDLQRREESKRDARWDPAEHWPVIQETISWADAQAPVSRDSMACCLDLQRNKLAAVTLAIIAAILVLTSPIPLEPPAACAGTASSPTAGPSSPQPFVDSRSVVDRLAGELGRLKEQGQTVSSAELAKQAGVENSYKLPTLPDRGEKLAAEKLYSSVKPGVVVVGGIYKCDKCRHWHARCASGFVVRQDGLIVTNYHVVDGYKDTEALGVMTDDGRVFPVKAVLAASRLDDLALLKVDATNLHALPVAADVPIGATIYCLSHPVLPTGAANGFYAFSQGIVCGKFVLQAERNQVRKALAVTLDYGPGSSGGPIVNERGAVVGVACQAIPLAKKPKENNKEKGAQGGEPKEGEKASGNEHEANVQMIWRFARPSCSLLAMLSTTTSKRPPAGEKPMPPAPRPEPQAKSPEVARAVAASGADAVSFELKPCDLPPVGYYRPARIDLTEDAPIKPKAEPTYRSKPLYGVLRLGETANSSFLVAIDEPTDGEPKIYIDRDGTGDLTRGPGDWQRNNRGSFFIGQVAIDVPYTTGKIPYKFSFYRMKARQPNALFYYRSSGRQGQVTLDGRSYRVLVMDDNADGRFDDLSHGSLIIDLNQDNKLDATMDSAEYFRLDEPFNVHGNVWEVASLSPDGLRIALRRSKASVPIKSYIDVGYQAPDFSAQGLDGQPIHLKTEAAKGRYVLLDFWASWCGPCRHEFPAISRAYAQYKNHGLTVIGVNLDSDRAKAVAAAEQAKLSYPHVFDGRGWKSEVAALYRIHGIPQILLIDSNLKIVAKNLRGPMLEKRLRELLGPGDEAAAKAIEQTAPPAKKAAGTRAK